MEEVGERRCIAAGETEDRQVPGRREGKAALFHVPERAGGAIQQVGQGLHHSEIERLVPVAGRDPLQQASPLLAIVELLLLQVLRQEMLDVGAKSAREQEDRKSTRLNSSH